LANQIANEAAGMVELMVWKRDLLEHFIALASEDGGEDLDRV